MTPNIKALVISEKVFHNVALAFILIGTIFIAVAGINALTSGAGIGTAVTGIVGVIIGAGIEVISLHLKFGKTSAKEQVTKSKITQSLARIVPPTDNLYQAQVRNYHLLGTNKLKFFDAAMSVTSQVSVGLAAGFGAAALQGQRNTTDSSAQLGLDISRAVVVAFFGALAIVLRMGSDATTKRVSLQQQELDAFYARLKLINNTLAPNLFTQLNDATNAAVNTETKARLLTYVNAEMVGLLNRGVIDIPTLAQLSETHLSAIETQKNIFQLLADNDLTQQKFLQLNEQDIKRLNAIHLDLIAFIKRLAGNAIFRPFINQLNSVQIEVLQEKVIRKAMAKEVFDIQDLTNLRQLTAKDVHYHNYLNSLKNKLQSLRHPVLRQ